jgi:hypothetical protein
MRETKISIMKKAMKFLMKYTSQPPPNCMLKVELYYSISYKTAWVVDHLALGEGATEIEP